MVNVLVSAYAPFPSTLAIQLPGDAPALSTLRYVLAPLCEVDSQSLSLRSGRSIQSSCSFADLAAGDDVHVRLAVRLPGGKGGFGSQLRAAGGRMNSKRSGQNNTDSCRDLNGRRLSTIKEAKKLADYLASAPEREAARIQQTREKLEKLQEEIRKADGEIAAANGSASASTSGPAAERPAEGQGDVSISTSSIAAGTSPGNTAAAGRKRRLDDQKYIEESREINDNVKSAVAAGEQAHDVRPLYVCH